VTDDSAFKKQARARMTGTGEKYIVARRMASGRDPVRAPVILRVYLNRHVDLELTAESGRTYAAADEQGQRDMVNRLLADHIEAAGSEEARGAAGSEIITDHELFVSHRAEGEAAEDAAIRSVVQQRVGREAGVSAVEVGHSGDQVWVAIRAAQPGVVVGHGGAEADRIRAELEELTGKPVLLNIMDTPDPQEGPEAAGSGSASQRPKS
jgi:KH domain